MLALFLFAFTAFAETANRTPASIVQDWSARPAALEKEEKIFAKSLTFHAYYVGDNVWNTNGGVKVDQVSLGIYGAKLGMDLDKGFGLSGGELLFHGLGTHGKKATVLVGDAQTTSNAEGQTDTFKLYEAWYKQAFDGTSFLAGLYDLNSEFYVTENSGMFLNSSFGIGKEFSQTGKNGPSIFPTTALALRFRQQSSAGYSQFAVFDAVAGDPNNPQGTQVKLDPQEGILMVAEGGVYIGPEGNDNSGKIAVGAWTYNRNFDHLTEKTSSGEAVQVPSNGFYALVTYWWSEEFSAFVRWGVASPESNRFASNGSMGFVYKGAMFGRKNDEVGLAVTAAGNGLPYRQQQTAAGADVKINETASELSYKFNINDDIFIQPDLQYIVHPNTNPLLENATVATLRFRLGF